MKGNQILFAVLIPVILIGTIILFLFPDIVDYKYSYVKLSEKKDMIERNNDNMIRQERNINSKIIELSNLEEDKDEVYGKASRLKREIREEDFELDIPSLLISLEQNARELEVSLDIGYGQINTVSGGGSSELPNEGELEENDGGAEENDSESNGENDTNEKQDEQGDNVTIEDKDSEMFTDEQLKGGTVEIDGLDVTIVPIVISGSYSNVRAYIRYLDRVGFIEPTSVIMESEEKEVEAQIVLNVIHGEVF